MSPPAPGGPSPVTNNPRILQSTTSKAPDAQLSHLKCIFKPYATESSEKLKSVHSKIPGGCQCHRQPFSCGSVLNIHCKTEISTYPLCYFSSSHPEQPTDHDGDQKVLGYTKHERIKASVVLKTVQKFVETKMWQSPYRLACRLWALKSSALHLYKRSLEESTHSASFSFKKMPWQPTKCCRRSLKPLLTQVLAHLVDSFSSSDKSRASLASHVGRRVTLRSKQKATVSSNS